jgi:hypothetical protein
MLHIAYIILSSNKKLKIKQEETRLLLKSLEIGRRKRNYRVMYVGDHTNAHNQTRRICEVLLNKKQNILTFFYKQSNQQKKEYRTRLNASIDCIRFL